MRIAHYFEMEDLITGGHARSVENQRTILEDHGITYTTEPDLEADILHLNNMGLRSIYYAHLARRKGIPVLVHAHQTAEDFRNSFLFSNILAYPLRPYLKYAYSLADRLVCPSQHTAATIAGYTDVERTVISNGIDRSTLEGWDDPDLREQYRDRYDLDGDVVFCVGHVIKRKGLETFIETARAMPDTDFVWFGYLNPLGEGSTSLLQGGKTVTLVKNAPDNCQFTGYIDDIRGAYAAGDIFYFPTRNENQGIALMEAMACGKPVVTRNIPTYEGWLEDGVHCRKADSLEGFVTALEGIMDEPELAERLGNNAAAEIEDNHALDVVGEELIACYESLLEEA